MSRPITALALLMTLACERQSPHVYSSPPPSPPNAAKGATTASAPDIPMGAIGPGARLVAIADAATGVPVALGNIIDSIDVLTLAAFGPSAGASRDGGRVELVVHGYAMDTTLVLPLSAPASNVVAHAFRIAGLKPGRYTAVVRLRTRSGQPIAESIATQLEVIAR
jgi:hypothetical protein